MIAIEFDHPDRRYRFGEPVSGKVLVQVKREPEPGTKVWVSWGWRTHGWGNEDKGKQEKLQLSQDYITFPVEKTVVFPFRLNLPNGPASYHGHNINVDWYVTAYLTHPALFFRQWDQRMLKVEQDFLLLGGRTRGPVVLGLNQVPEADVPRTFSGRPPDPAGLVEAKSSPPAVGIPPVEWEKAVLMIVPLAVLLLLDFSMYILWGPASGGSYRTPVFVVALLAILAALPFINRGAYRGILGQTEMWVRPATICAGSPVTCHIRFRTRRKVRLRQIKINLSAWEVATSSAGTDTKIEKKLVYETTFVKPYEKELEAGRDFCLDSSLPLEADAPPTFFAVSNRLEWKIRLEVDLRGWLDWVRTFPLTVLPPLPEEAISWQ